MDAEPPCRILEWDSKFFGKRIASLTGATLTEARVVAAVDWCRTQRVECLYVLTDADDMLGLRLLEDAGARLVDVRMLFERKLTAIPTDARKSVRASSESDIADLRALASSSHESSRFWADAHFERERCAELYATWIEKSCRGWADVVFVAELEKRVAGYVSCHLREPGRGEIGIVAVAPDAQGRGLGGDLLDTALAWFAQRDLERVTVVTQGRNAAAQRLYQSRGFTTESVKVWHHLWFTPDEARA